MWPFHSHRFIETGRDYGWSPVGHYGNRVRKNIFWPHDTEMGMEELATAATLVTKECACGGMRQVWLRGWARERGQAVIEAEGVLADLPDE